MSEETKEEVVKFLVDFRYYIETHFNQSTRPGCSLECFDDKARKLLGKLV
jgi:hypothetical protein